MKIVAISYISPTVGHQLLLVVVVVVMMMMMIVTGVLARLGGVLDHRRLGGVGLQPPAASRTPG
jgi:hypothetical protein